ncbi:hypothetical protein Tco_1320208 [Tanacetum coccineum]
MVAWFLRLEDDLSWLLAVGNCDAITVLRNAIAFFKLVIGSSPGRNNGTTRLESSWGNLACGCCDMHEMDKQFVELMVIRELLEAYTVSNEKVLHKIVNVVEKGNTIEQL